MREDLVPPALDGLELGEDVLEGGPGFGPATELLSARPFGAENRAVVVR